MSGPLLTLVIWGMFVVGDRWEPMSARICAVGAIWMAIGPILGVITHSIDFGDVVCTAMAGWFAYLAWTRRKPRQRKPSKVAGMVRDLGHRLVVVPS